MRKFGRLLPRLILLAWVFAFSGNAQAFTGLSTVIEKQDAIPRKHAFSFAVIGDSQPADTFGQYETFKKILSEINKSGAGFVVHLGDKIRGGGNKEAVRKQYEEFLSALKGLEVEIRHTAGNHDISGSRENEKLYGEFFGPLYYSFSHKSSFFIILNTETAGEEGEIKGRQMAWLEGELEKSKQYRDVFVFMHRPLFSAIFSGKSHLHFSSAEHRDKLANILKDCGVTAVFAGHEHLYHGSRHNGLKQVISGAGGAPFHFYPAGNFHHYLIVSVKEDRVTIEAVPVSAEDSETGTE